MYKHNSKLYVINNKFLATIVLTALTLPEAAMATDAPASPHTVTSNIGMVSNYVFRGITQTVGKPALQGGLDYSHSSGFYAGIWGSNVSWITGSGSTGDASLELDTYGGFKSTFADDFSYDVGYIRYGYHGTYIPPATYVKADTEEVYGVLGYKWISAKYSHALGQFLMVPEAGGTSYLEVNASYPVSAAGITLGAHYGKQTYKGTFADSLAAAGNTATYSDYKLSVTKDIGGYVWGLAYSNTNARPGGYYTYTSTSGARRDWGQSTTVLSVLHAF